MTYTFQQFASDYKASALFATFKAQTLHGATVAALWAARAVNQL